MLTGSLVALATPMHENTEIDYESFKNLIEWHIQEGTDALVIAGTTGESPTLSFEEHAQVIKFAVDTAKKRIPIIAGAGANNTKEAIHLTEKAKLAGADYVLSVVPYYNKPSQEGMYQHFKAIANAVDMPIILYNVPGRTVADLQNDTVLRLAELDNIVGVKDATGNIERACDLIKRVPKDFLLYSGDDPTSMAFLLSGGHGVITVCANLVPKLFAQMCRAAIDKNFTLARELNEQLQVIYPCLFCEPSPAAVKWALYKMGKCHYQARLPIVDLSPNGQKIVTQALEPFNLF
ncbi:4-hydroxy-tetrahydrodipicolinate synthase [Neisseriaceae bacterium PsAf]|nr:4-hydroxy-tetrahydrodipicolinate synthase [Neisseriaceae bacterium PsAf]MCV2503520.1 4-hydroxy-tetrahydrodipicolinate synthase [Neisseriaceae bacterium]